MSCGRHPVVPLLVKLSFDFCRVPHVSVRCLFLPWNFSLVDPLICISHQAVPALLFITGFNCTHVTHKIQLGVPLHFGTPHSETFSLGFFALANGRQESLTSSTNRVTNYVTYDSSFTCADNTSSPILIRHFSPQHAVLVDNTIVFIIAKAGFPTVLTEPIVFQALYFFPVPGVATSPEYEDAAPDMLYPVAFVVGHVTTALSPATDHPRTFSITTTSYVTTGNVTSSVQCVFANQKRWAKAPNVPLTTCVAVLGSFSSIAADNQLSIAVDDITLNLSSKMTAPLASPSTSSTTKRKFNAYSPRKTSAVGSVGPTAQNMQASSSSQSSFTLPSSYSHDASEESSNVLPPSQASEHADEDGRGRNKRIKLITSNK